MAVFLFLLYLIFTLTVLYREVKSPVWEIGSALYLIVAVFFVGMPLVAALVLLAVIGLSIALIHAKPLRHFIAKKLYAHAKKSVPKLSKTEEEALNAGDVWVEQDIFIGKPNWQRLAAISSDLTPEEASFLQNETEVLCQMLDDWAIIQEGDLPENVWSYIKDNGFFGLVIAKEFGGKGFSARAHSDIVMKVASRSGVAAVTIMVPNSLGPGELLQFYGTDAQKQQHLPRLAKGIDIPCFALTEPGAGSDATSIQAEAIVTRQLVNGVQSLTLTINHLNKRWITLAPVATLIGLAVNLKDPEHLLDGVGTEGITCVLIPRDTKNLEIGNRHLPANQPFMNGTIRGENIVVSIETIIGGQKNAGRGWQMLVECLSIGRSISLPALGAASSTVSYLTSGAFARARRQFSVEIAQFEGIEEKLAEVAGLNYLINSTRLLTVAAVNEHKKPSVASAITKYFNTELARIVVNDAMDIHGGRAVVTGPRNYLTSCYMGVPISITVEGANIMSRNLLIFGQGSMACHPFIREEFYAVAREDEAAFEGLLWQHIGYFLTNMTKTIVSTLTAGLLIIAPRNKLHRQYQRLARLSHAFAWIADFSLIYLGGELKRKERLSARLADGMSYLYLAMGALRSYQESGQDSSYEIHARWATTYCYYHAQKALIAVCDNFPSPFIGGLIRFIAFPLGQTMAYPTDKMDHQLAQLMAENSLYRDTIKKAIYLSGDAADPIDKMEETLQLIIKNKPLLDKVRSLKRFSFAAFKKQLNSQASILELTPEEQAQLITLERARWDAIQVDEFEFDSMKNKQFNSVTNDLKTPLD